MARIYCTKCDAQYRKSYTLGAELTCKSCGEKFIAGDAAATGPTNPDLEEKVKADTGEGFEELTQQVEADLQQQARAEAAQQAPNVPDTIEMPED